jgi:flagellar hook-length control protein FliK
MKLDRLDAAVLPVAVDRKGSRPGNDDGFSFGKLVSDTADMPSRAETTEASDAEKPGNPFHFHSGFKLKSHGEESADELAVSAENVQEESQDRTAADVALLAAMEPDAAKSVEAAEMPNGTVAASSTLAGTTEDAAAAQDNGVQDHLETRRFTLREFLARDDGGRNQPNDVAGAASRRAAEDTNSDKLKTVRQLDSGVAVRPGRDDVQVSRQSTRPMMELNTIKQGNELNVTRFEFGRAGTAGQEDDAAAGLRLENGARNAIDRVVGRVVEKSARGGASAEQMMSTGQQGASPLAMAGSGGETGAAPVVRQATLDQVPSMIRDMIVKQQSLRSENAQTLSLQLTPRHLGTISVNVTHENGAMKIEIVTGSAAASQAFGNIRQDVAKTFQALGIAMDDISVRLTEVRQPGNAQQGGQPGSGNQQNGSGQSYSMGGFAGGNAGGGSQSREGDPGGWFESSIGTPGKVPRSELAATENRSPDSLSGASGKTLYV